MRLGLGKVTINNSAFLGKCGWKAHVMGWLTSDCALSLFHPAYRGVLNSPVKTVRDTLITQCAQILACYRKNCASPSSAGQVRQACWWSCWDEFLPLEGFSHDH